MWPGFLIYDVFWQKANIYCFLWKSKIQEQYIFRDSWFPLLKPCWSLGGEVELTKDVEEAVPGNVEIDLLLTAILGV